MIITNTKTQETFTLKRHKKLPSFAATGIKKKIRFQGKENAFIFHPSRPQSTRTSLIVGDTRFYSDDPTFKAYVEGLKGTAEFNPAEGRVKKTAASEAAPKAKGTAVKPKAQPKAQAATAKGKTKAQALAPEQVCRKCSTNPAIYATHKGEPRCKDCGVN